MKYILESAEENERLERQSREIAYNYKEDLEDLKLSDFQNILDAGCGSGVVSRYIADQAPRSTVTGCDISPSRVEEARSRIATKMTGSLKFEVQDLRATQYQESSFNLIYSRYVAEHQTQADLLALVGEWKRILKPGGVLRIVDVDGCFHNIYPQTELLARGLKRLEAASELDLRVGRKLPFIACSAGLKEIDLRISTHAFRGESLKAEIEIVKDRFRVASEFFKALFGSELESKRFEKEYLAAMQVQGSVLFYNRFITSFTKV